MRSNRPSDALVAADQALDLAEHLGLARVLAETLNNKGSSLAYLGRNVEGEALLRAAAEVAHEGGFVNAEVRALSNLSARNDQPEVSRQWAAQARELAVRIGNRSMANWTTEIIRFSDYLLAERWEQAMDPRGYDDDPTVPIEMSPLDEVRTLALSGLVRAARGLPVDEAIVRLGELATRTTDAFAGLAVDLLRCEERLARGDYPAAARSAFGASTEPNVGTQFLGTAAHAALWGGDIAIARQALASLEAHPASDAIAASDRLALRATIATLDGRPDEALPAFRESLALLRSHGGSWNVARRLLDFLVAFGPDDPLARDWADEARATFERVAAEPYLAKLDELLGTPASPTRSTGDRVASA